MANEYSVSLKMRGEIVEVLDASLAIASVSRDSRTLKHLVDVDKTLNAGTVPTVTKVAVFSHTLVDEDPDVDDVIDLTALTHAVAQAVDATALKVVGIVIQADSENAAAVVVEAGASNGYTLLGAAFKVAIAAGATLMYDGAGPAISGTVKTLDVSGTPGDVIAFMILFGVQA